MAVMLFDQAGTRYYHTGVSALALFVMGKTGDTLPTAPSTVTAISGYSTWKTLYRAGVPWNGITNATNSPSGGDETELWADNIKYGSLRAAEKSGGSIECYQFPKEFWECNGAVIVNGVVVGQQERRKFAFAYKSNVGNDQTTGAGEVLHLVWNASTNPSEHSSETINDSPDAGTFSFEYSADSVAWTDNTYNTMKAVSTMEIDTTTLTNGKTNANYVDLLNMIYGKNESAPSAGDEIVPQMPSPDVVLALMGRALPAAG